MVNWKACFTIAIACFIGAVILPYEYEFLTQNMPLEQPKETKEGFDFMVFMLYLVSFVFVIAGIVEIVRSKHNSA